MSPQVKGSLFATLSALGFGTMPIFAAISYRSGASVETVLTWRFLLAALLLWAIVWRWKYTARIGLMPAIQSMLLGVCGYSAMAYCYFSALQYISASLTVLLLYTYPVFVMILSILFKLEKWEWRKGAALAFSIAGMVLLIGLSTEQPQWFGVMLGSLAGIMYSVFILASRRVGAQVHVFTMTAYTVSGAFFSLLIIGLAKGTVQYELPAAAFASIAAIALLATVLAITLMNASIQLVGASRASIISTLEPVFTILLAYLFFHETMNGMQMVGAALIMLALLLLQLPARRAGEYTAAETITVETITMNK